MDLKNINTFILVAELGSFTKAADTLGYAQSTVSAQIKQLEEELNVQLFERINRTVCLTESGKTILNYAHQMNILTREMEEDALKKDKIEGHVRLATADSMCKQLLGEPYLNFHKEYPGITVKFITVGIEEMKRLLNHNEIDLIYTLDNHIYSTEFVIAHEEKIGVHFVTSSKHPLASAKELKIGDLLQEDFILTEKGMSYRRILDEKLASMSLVIDPVLETSNADQICWLLEHEMGISFLPDYTTEKAVQEGKLVYLDVTDVEIDIWKQLLYHKDKWISPVMQTLIDYFKSL